MLDEHLLQYKPGGTERELEIVIGLDFGTSASKVVVRVPDLPGEQAFAVDFGEFAHPSMPCLLPTRLWVAENGECDLARREGGRVINDIKLELFADGDHLNNRNGPTRQGFSVEAIATAYLALLLRHTRHSFLEGRRNLVGHAESLNWSMNLGVPSPCIEDNAENARFRLVGKAAWMLSVMAGSITVGRAEDELRYMRDAPDYWERDDDGLACDFELIPEIAAAASGYALTDVRREGLHLIVDIGAATVDLCGFLLYARDGDRYSLLTAIRVYHERIEAIRRVHQERADELRDSHDPLTPMGDDIDMYLPARERVVRSVEEAEGNVRRHWYSLLKRVVRCLKERRVKKATDWPTTLPLLVIGGGSRLPFFASLVEESRERLGARLVELPIADTFPDGRGEAHRIAVAWGLSNRALDVGDITPADRIGDVESSRESDWRGRFIGMEDV